MPFPLAAGLTFVSVLLAGAALLGWGGALWERGRVRYVHAAAETLDAAWLAWPVRRVVAAGAAAAAGLAAPAALAHPAAALPAAATGLAAPLVILGILARRRTARAAAQVPETLDALSRALQAGHALPQALAGASRSVPSPMGRELALVAREIEMGVPLGEALGNWSSRIPDPDLSLATAGIRLALEVGGSLAPTLQNLAQTVRERRSAGARLRALTAQGRMQAWVVGLLPFALAGFLAWLDPAAFGDFLRRPAGMALVALAILLQGLGAAWIRWIVRP